MELNTVEFVIELGYLIKLTIKELFSLVLSSYVYMHNYYELGDHLASGQNKKNVVLEPCASALLALSL